MGRSRAIRVASLLQRAGARCNDKSVFVAPHRAWPLSDLPVSSLGETRFLSTLAARTPAFSSEDLCLLIKHVYFWLLCALFALLL